MLDNVAYAANIAKGSGNITNETTGEIANLVAMLITKIPLWLTSFLLILATLVLAKIVRSVVENKLAESGIEEDHKEVQILGGRISFVTVLLIGFTVALKVAGIDLTALIAAVGFGVGFALKDMIMNFLAGIMIILGRHFSIGDFINVGGVLGKVVEIQSRVTILQAINGTKVIVPNADIFSQKVTSYTSNPFRRIDIEIGVDYRANLENAMKVFLDVASRTKGVLATPKPSILFSEWGDYEIVLKVRVWVESKGPWLKIKSNLNHNLKKAYDDFNIQYSWPITQVVYDKEAYSDEEKLFEDRPQRISAAPLPATPVRVIADRQNPAPIDNSKAGPNDFDDSQPLKPLAEN